MKILLARYALIFTLAVCLFPTVASATTISPKIIDLDLEKRDIVERTITLTNNGTRPTRIYPTVHEIAIDENGEIEKFTYATNNKQTDTVTSWIEVPRGRITVEPGETYEVPVRIKIHPQAQSGNYVVFVAFSNAANKSDAEKRAMAGKSDGTIIRISVEKDRTEFLKLESFSVERFVTGLEEDSTIFYRIANNGQAPLVPEGELILYDTKGVEVGSVPVNPGGVELQPDSSQEFSSSLPDTLRAGKYKAFLNVDYGIEQRASLMDTTFFYNMPIMTMIIIFLSVMSFAILLTFLIYRRVTPTIIEDGAHDVSMYLREGNSEAKDHDLDLNKKE